MRSFIASPRRHRVGHTTAARPGRARPSDRRIDSGLVTETLLAPALVDQY
jgi:hypothetical protein